MVLLHPPGQRRLPAWTALDPGRAGAGAGGGSEARGREAPESRAGPNLQIY